MSLRLITPPAEEPVTLAEAKDHLRIMIDAQDGYIAKLITKARADVEAYLGRALVTQAWDLTLDAWPPSGEIRPPLPPLIAAGPITYVGTDASLYTMAATDYRVSPGTPGRIRPAPGKSWPSLYRVMDAVTVRFVAGYGAAGDVPPTLHHAILLLVGHWFDHREAAGEPTVGGGVVELPLGLDRLLAAEVWKPYS